MILFVGSPEKSYFAETVAEDLGMKITRIPASTSIMNQEKRIFDTPCNYMIFDTDQYTDEIYVLATEFLKLKNAKNTEIIIFAPGLSKDHAMITEFQKYGFTKFIFSLSLGERKEELRALLIGEEYKKEYLTAQEVQKHVVIKTNLKSIAVTGVMHRTGTTTQAVQIVKYLLVKGYHACYIEANQSGYVKRLAEWYSEDECKIEERVNANGEKKLFKIKMNDLDMFCDTDFLPEILTMNYDYFVYDYGVYTSPNFNKISFSEKSVKIITCGSEPDELECTKEILENIFYDEVQYVFSFVAETDQEEIRVLMDEKAKYTFFAPYTPDKFRYSSDELYEKLLPMNEKIREEDLEKKPGFFAKLFGRKKNV